MAHSKTWARRLLREMPADPEKLLDHPSYSDPVFLGLLLDHVEEQIYRNPRAGLKLARVAPKLAHLVPEKGRERQHGEQLVRAHAILGNARRALGWHDAAEAEFGLAFKIADSLAVSPSSRADLDRRLSVLRACQKRFAEAQELTDKSVEAFRRLKDRQGLAHALATRGYVLNEAELFAEAIPCHGEALQLAGKALRLATRKKPAPAAITRIYETARINLSFALSQSGPELASMALDHIRAALRELHGQRRCIQRHRLQWIEGRAWLKLRLDRRAEQAFKVARRGFVRLDAPWEIALVSLDLAALYRCWDEWENLEALAEDTFRRFRELAADYESIAALSLWVDAVQARKGVEATIEAARQVLEDRQRKGGP